MMITIWSICVLLFTACTENSPDTDPALPPVEVSLSEQNLIRAMELADKAVTAHFTGSGMAMARYYNPYTGVRSDEIGSVWMYSAAIEAVNAILHGLQVQKENGNAAIHDEHFDRYAELLAKLYDNADYYEGTFELVSYTQTKEWSVYGVNRGNAKGTAKVEGIENVYDDQMWLVRELLESYKITGENAYLEKAEYLTDYVLDGWDSTRNPDGTERGGIPWGPGYVTKHACSNGPTKSTKTKMTRSLTGTLMQMTRKPESLCLLRKVIIMLILLRKYMNGSRISYCVLMEFTMICEEDVLPEIPKLKLLTEQFIAKE